MKNSLSNPYLLTVGGVTVKTSPMSHNGYFVSNADLSLLSEDEKNKFKKALFHEYDVEQMPNMWGIKVFGKKKDEKGS